MVHFYIKIEGTIYQALVIPLNMLVTLCICFISLILLILWSRYCYYPHFTDQKTDLLRGQAPHSRVHRQNVRIQILVILFQNFWSKLNIKFRLLQHAQHNVGFQCMVVIIKLVWVWKDNFKKNFPGFIEIIIDI